jgi:pyruvate dehydrogenase E2 component (dihydrolipoamide acetyltransferase)
VTISNLGDRGAESIFGVVYPPQVALIGFGRIAQRPWVVDDEIKVRTLVNASLAADHRVSDGHQGSLLLSAIDRALQSPSTL